MYAWARCHDVIRRPTGLGKLRGPFSRVWGSNQPRHSEGPRPSRDRPDLAENIRKITGWAFENKTGKHRGVPRLTMSQGADRRPLAHAGSSGRVRVRMGHVPQGHAQASPCCARLRLRRERLGRDRPLKGEPKTKKSRFWSGVGRSSILSQSQPVPDLGLRLRLGRRKPRP